MVEYCHNTVLLFVQLPQNEELEKFPVLFLIHGGAFMFGGSETYGAKLLMDRQVVLVTFNYRVGPLGE